MAAKQRTSRGADASNHERYVHHLAALYRQNDYRLVAADGSSLLQFIDSFALTRRVQLNSR